jgi:hypothetical protein
MGFAMLTPLAFGSSQRRARLLGGIFVRSQLGRGCFAERRLRSKGMQAGLHRIDIAKTFYFYLVQTLALGTVHI